MLTNNRRGALVPKTNLEISIGSEYKRLNIFYGSNIDLSGEIKANKISGDGSGLKNITLQNVLQDHIGSSSNLQFGDFYCKSLHVENNINANAYEGCGNHITFNGIKNNIIPGDDRVSIGIPGKEFNTIYGKDIFATNNVIAGKFQGDGSLLQNITTKPDFKNVDMDIISISNEKFDIGKDYSRFNTLYTKNVSANGSIMGNKLMITNSIYPISDEPKIIKAPWNYDETLSSDILDKLGSQIDISCDNIIVGIAIFNEIISDKITIRSVFKPENPGTCSLGTISEPFLSAHVCHINVQKSLSNLGDLDINGQLNCSKNGNFEQNVNVLETVTASNFVGDGRFLTGINHIDNLSSNLVPLYNNYIDLGSSNQQFNNVFSNKGNFDDIHVNNGNVNGKLDVKGSSMKHNGYNVASYISGYCVPKLKTFNNMEVLPFSEEYISHFTDVDMNTGLIKIKTSGLYNIGFYGWSTSRGYALDPFVLWKIEHYNSYANKVSYYYMKSAEVHSMLTSMILRKSDTIKIMVEPGSSRINNAPTTSLTVYEKGALVITLNTIFDKFI